MTAPDMDQFRTYLLSLMRDDDPQAEILRHEMSATLNRNRMTGLQEGIHSFNTDQLCWLLPSNPQWEASHWLVQGLVLSAVIDARWDIVDKAEACNVISELWTWWPIAKGFTGDQAALATLIQGQVEWRQRCGVVSLATRARPELITATLLLDFARADLSRVYYMLLVRGLKGPDGRNLARAALLQCANCPELIFAGDVDPTIAELVRVGQPEDPDLTLAPFKDVIGDLTKGAIAELELERGRPHDALRRLNGLRQLSVSYPRSVLVAVLAALESKNFEIVRRHLPHIPDAKLRFKIATRLAQAVNDPPAELDALTELYELDPNDASVFTQLITALDRMGQDEISRHLCFTNQERFLDQADVLKIIARHTG